MFLLGAASLLFAGCRSTHRGEFPRIINEPAPLPEALRREFGVIGVLPVAMATNVHWNRPADGSEAFGTVAGKTWSKLMDSAEFSGSFDKDDLASDAATIGLVTLISLTAGTASALAFGTSDTEFQRCDARLRKALTEEPIDRGIQKHLEKLVLQRGSTDMQLLPDSALGQIVLRGDKPDFSAFSAAGIDSIMDIRVSELCFEVRNGLNPELAFAPEITISLHHVSDGTVRHTSALSYRGKRRSFGDWADRDAKSFRSDMKNAERLFARMLVDQYFASRQARP